MIPDESDVHRWKADAWTIIIAILAAAFGFAGHWALCGCSGPPYPPEPPVVETLTKVDAGHEAAAEPVIQPPLCPPTCPGSSSGEPPRRQ